MPGRSGRGCLPQTGSRMRRCVLVGTLTLVQIKTAELEPLLPEGLFQVRTPVLDRLHGGRIAHPETRMDLAAFHPQVDGDLAKGFGMQLELGFLAPVLEHPAYAAVHLGNGGARKAAGGGRRR